MRRILPEGRPVKYTSFVADKTRVESRHDFRGAQPFTNSAFCKDNERETAHTFAGAEEIEGE